VKRLRGASVIVVAALALLFSGTANAAQVNAAGHVYISQFEDCAFAHAHMDDTSGHPNLWTYASMDWYNANGSCRATTALARAGTLSVGQDLLYYSNGWRYCNVGQWYYNQSTTHDMSTSWSPYRPCGEASYILNGYARTWNGTWHGGYNQTQLIYSG
jgi:hypothetical protein